MSTPSRRWLSDFTTIYETLANLKCISKIINEIIIEAGTREPFHDIVETLFIDAVKMKQQKIAKELIKKMPRLQELHPVADIKFKDVKGRYSSADIELFLIHTDMSESRIPVNIKVERATTQAARAVSLLQLLNHLTVQDYTFSKTLRGDADSILCALIGGGTKLIPGKDYALAVINVATQTLEIRSLISRLKPGSDTLALFRQNNRDVICYTSPVGKLIDVNFDIARELAYALLPNDSTSRISANIIRNTKREDRQAIALKLQDLNYTDIIKSLSI